MPAEPIVECRDLTRRYGTFTALESVSLSVAPGEIVAVLGPNGAGKSTLMRVCAGLIGPSGGTATVCGVNVQQDPGRVRAQVGLVLGDSGFYDAMTVHAYLTFFGQCYGLGKADSAARTADLLAHFELADQSKSRVSSLSQGMRQKVALARALLHEPDVLLLDEPTNGLDPAAAARFRADITALRSASRGILLCTHMLHEADELADRVVILQGGRAVAYETPSALKLSAAGGRHRVRLVLSESSRPKRRDFAGLELDELVLDGNIVSYETADVVKTNPAVVKKLVSAGLGVVTVEAVGNTLEAAYLAIVAPNGTAR